MPEYDGTFKVISTADGEYLVGGSGGGGSDISISKDSGNTLTDQTTDGGWYAPKTDTSDKLDKKQKASDKGKILGIANDGTITPIEAPAAATTSKIGLVKPDGTTITIDSNGKISSKQAETATTEKAGIVKPDGTTITIEDGVISAVGGSSSSSVIEIELSDYNNLPAEEKQKDIIYFVYTYKQSDKSKMKFNTANEKIAILDGREYFKSTSDIAIGGYGSFDIFHKTHESVWKNPILASKVPEGVWFTPANEHNNEGTFTYNGETWYKSGVEYAMYGGDTSERPINLDNISEIAEADDPWIAMLDYYYNNLEKNPLKICYKNIEYAITNIATTDNLGLVKPDGSSITIDEDGVISAVGGGSGGGTTLNEIGYSELQTMTEEEIEALGFVEVLNYPMPTPIPQENVPSMELDLTNGYLLVKNNNKIISKIDITQSLVPIMTSNTTPSGEAFGVGPRWDSLCDYFHLFNRDYTTPEVVDGCSNGIEGGTWTAYDFVNPVSVIRYLVVDEIATPMYPSNWKIQATNDKDGEWITLDEQTRTSSSEGLKSYFNIPSNKIGEYRYYRIFFPEDAPNLCGGSPGSWSLQGIEFFGIKEESI